MYSFWRCKSVNFTNNALSPFCRNKIQEHWFLVLNKWMGMKNLGTVRYPLFRRGKEDAIVFNVVGDSLNKWRQGYTDINTLHLEKLEPSMHRNWNMVQGNETEMKRFRSNGIQKCLQQVQLVSLQSALDEIQAHIKVLNTTLANVQPDHKLVLDHLHTWLTASLQAGKIYNQYLKLKDEGIENSFDVILRLENIARPIEESLDILMAHHRELIFDDFKTSILALGCWLPLHIPSMNVKHPLQKKINELLNKLETGSFERINPHKLPAGSPILLKSHLDKLDLAVIWIFALVGGNNKDKNHLNKIRGDSFSTGYIRKVTDRKTRGIVTILNLLNMPQLKPLQICIDFFSKI